MPHTTTRSARLDRAMSLLARRGTLTRFHRRLVRAAGVDIDRAGYLVLRRIRREGPTRITDLADLMGVEPSTASRHVQVLVDRGWLAKQPSFTDRRVSMAEVTDTGAAIVDRIETERHRILDHTLSRWSDVEIERFVVLFERFADDLNDTLTTLDERKAAST